MNEYTIAAITCGCILVLWALVIIGCEVWRYVWSWVDEEKPLSNIVLTRLRKLNKWKYPVYNGEYVEGVKIFGYAKDKKLNKASVFNLVEGVDYVYEWKQRDTTIIKIIAISSTLPLTLLVSFKIYPVTIGLCLTVLVAHLARFTRRLSKMFKVHATNKKIHSKSK